MGRWGPRLAVYDEVREGGRFGWCEFLSHYLWFGLKCFLFYFCGGNVEEKEGEFRRKGNGVLYLIWVRGEAAIKPMFGVKSCEAVVWRRLCGANHREFKAGKRGCVFSSKSISLGGISKSS